MLPGNQKDFIYFTFRQRGREGERDREKHQCVVASHAPPTGDLACTPGMYPYWKSNQRPFCSQASTQSTEPHLQGWHSTSWLLAPAVWLRSTVWLYSAPLFYSGPLLPVLHDLLLTTLCSVKALHLFRLLSSLTVSATSPLLSWFSPTWANTIVDIFCKPDSQTDPQTVFLSHM